MKLTKIKYASAVVFGVLALVGYFILGLLQWSIKDYLVQTYGVAFNPLSVFVYTPIVGGIVAYLAFMLAILIYNCVAMKFPVSWEVKK